MAVKNQIQELNRTNTVFIDPADFGAFALSYNSLVLRGDSARKIYITGFVFEWTVGVAADINVNNFSNVFLVENFIPNPDPAIGAAGIFPFINGSLRFAYGETMNQFTNQIEKQFEAPFKLLPSTIYSVLGTIQQGAAFVGTTTTRLTVFGFEEEESQRNSFYGNPRQ